MVVSISRGSRIIKKVYILKTSTQKTLIDVCRKTYSSVCDAHALPQFFDSLLIERGARSHAILATFINNYSFDLLTKDPSVVSAIDLLFVDGIFLVHLLRCMLGLRCFRASFDRTSLAPIVFSICERKNLRVALVGAKPRVIDSALTNIRSDHPQLNVVYVHHGYFGEDARSTILDGLVGARPDLVVTGMGTPLQENFLVDLKARCWHGVGLTCGGFFEQTAERYSYYPNWVDRANLRWAYRLYREPGRLWRRYLLDYPRFTLCFIANILFKHK